jgi:hypothetical protein
MICFAALGLLLGVNAWGCCLGLLQGLRQGQRVPIEFFTFGERHRRKSSILHVNWSW